MLIRVFALMLACWSLSPARLSSAADEPAVVDRYGDPLPPAAIARLGTVRFRTDYQTVGVGFSPDGRTVIAASHGIYWWDAATGKPKHKIRFKGHSLQKSCVSLDGKTLAIFRPGNEPALGKRIVDVSLWDIAGRKRRLRFRVVPETRINIRDVTFTTDGTALVIANRGRTGKLQVWSVDGTRRDEFNVELRSVDCVATAGNRIAVGGRDGIEIWSRTTGKRTAAVKDVGASIHAMAYSRDGKFLLVASQKSGYGLTLRDPENGTFLRRIGPVERRGYVRRITPAPDGERFAIAGFDRRTVEVWNVKTGDRERSFDLGADTANCVAFSKDGRRLAAGGSHPTVHVWDLKTGRKFGDERSGHATPPQFIEFLGDGKSIATAGDDGTIRVWEARTGKQRQVLRHGDVPKGRWNSITPWVRGFAVSPDGKLIGSSSLDDTVRLWNAATGKERFRLFGHGRLGGNRAVAFTSNGKRLVSWGEAKHLRVWDVRTGKLKIEHALEKGLDDDDPVNGRDRFDFPSGRLSPDGRLLLQTRGRELSVIDVVSAKTLTTWPTKGSLYGSTQAISRDGKLWLETESGPTQAGPGGVQIPASHYLVRLRRLPDGKQMLVFQLPGRYPGPVTFSHDTKRIATAGRTADDPIRIHDAKTGKTTRMILGMPSRPYALAFSRDGKLLAVALADSTVAIYDLSLIPSLEPPKGGGLK